MFRRTEIRDGFMRKKRPGRTRALLADVRFTKGRVSRGLCGAALGRRSPLGSARNNLGEEFRSQLLLSTTHFFESVFFGFCFRSFKSLLRPRACLLATRSSREMKFTGTPKKVLATLFLHASGNWPPVISVRMSMRAGAIPI